MSCCLPTVKNAHSERASSWRKTLAPYALSEPTSAPPYTLERNYDRVKNFALRKDARYKKKWATFTRGPPYGTRETPHEGDPKELLVLGLALHELENGFAYADYRRRVRKLVDCSASLTADPISFYGRFSKKTLYFLTLAL